LIFFERGTHAGTGPGEKLDLLKVEVRKTLPLFVAQECHIT
jgi:hypothetical protein